MTKSSRGKTIFVLDTSVILYDHNSIKNFQEHDIAIPITVLEELDTFKKGNDTINFEAREFIRFLDGLSGKYMLHDWIPLNGKTRGHFRVIMHEKNDVMTDGGMSELKADNQILKTALRLARETKDRNVVLVTKDINLRLKAKSLGLPAEDYETGKIKNTEKLFTGQQEITGVDKELIDVLYKKGTCTPGDIRKTKFTANSYMVLKSGKTSVLGYYNPVTQLIERVDRVPAYGITPRNAEQAFALHAVLNENIPLVSLMGTAGTGKTLIALAGALERRSRYRQIFLARPIVPLSNRDIGYLPGDIKSKLNPYMEPLWDNLKFIQSQFGEKSKEYQKITEMVTQEKLVIQPLAYIRGRSVSNVIFIVDEAQNLTPHEIKTIITRAGEGTKIVFTGDIHQIDTPYLDSQSNGLSYIVDRIRNNELYAHITLEKGERSALASMASELL